MSLFIALSGWKRSGKDTIADYLVKNHGFTRLAFADSLKNNVSQQFDVGRGMIEHPQLKESALMEYPVDPKDPFTLMIAKFMWREFRDAKDQKADDYLLDDKGTFTGAFQSGSIIESRQLYWTPRAICILEGSTKRTVDPNIWVKSAIRNATEDGLFVISDARYKNEIETLRKVAPEQVITVRIDGFDSVDSTDPSENDLNDFVFDFRINNRVSEGKTLEDVKLQVDEIVKSRR